MWVSGATCKVILIWRVNKWEFRVLWLWLIKISQLLKNIMNLSVGVSPQNPSSQQIQNEIIHVYLKRICNSFNTSYVVIKYNNIYTLQKYDYMTVKPESLPNTLYIIHLHGKYQLNTGCSANHFDLHSI